MAVGDDHGLVLGVIEEQAARLLAVLVVGRAAIQHVQDADALVVHGGGQDLFVVVLAADDGRLVAELVQLIDDVVDAGLGLGCHDDAAHGVVGNGDLLHVEVSCHTTSIRFVTHYL
ncbi:MAG: hypothetical protein A2537_01335 [Candidatus Magasanikbacteria bacterium RIFOXYD2_FULL_36_9]|uniref:Uncharacterized protein n=1 Tax=Candidatus Magasanikbacteria bacterium RIFOXYD2_FULL_36_9 TaxID=1798707 RepID=A0A1F6P172_9BACT|nr:MAG: hypothetical protein A2537_01335 [Candidatus Magasanikbacteria bacterium RIFOXYD2_FULL_36_9]